MSHIHAYIIMYVSAKKKGLFQRYNPPQKIKKSLGVALFFQGGRTERKVKIGAENPVLPVRVPWLPAAACRHRQRR